MIAVWIKAVAIASLGVAVAGTSVAKQPQPQDYPPGQPGEPPPRQSQPPPPPPPGLQRSQPAPYALPAPQSATSVMTEKQKYCRWQNHCPMDSSSCPPCRNVR